MANLVQDIEAEELFIGILANEPALIVPYSTRVAVEDFSVRKNRLLWECFNRALVEKQRPTAEWSRYWLEGQYVNDGRSYYQVVGEQYLRHVFAPELLLGRDPPIVETGKIEFFASRILDAADRQLRYEISENLRASADQKGVNADTLWSELIGRVLERRQKRGTVKRIGAYWDRIKPNVKEWWRGDPGNLITTGYPSLDYALGGGLAPKRMIVIGGASGGAKTTLLLNIMYELASRGNGTGMSSVEMAGEDLFMLLACRQAGIPYRDLRQGLLATQGGQFKSFELEKHKAMEARFYEEVERIIQLPIQVDDSSDMVTSATVYMQILLAAAFSDVTLWGVDYAELLADNENGSSESVRIPAIFKACKNIARLLSLVLALLSQLTKDIKHRPDAKPKMEDLRYGTPAPADYVWLNWFPGGLIATGDINKNFIKKRYGDLGVTGDPNQLVVIQAKARYGQPQFILLDYQPAIGKLSDPNQHLATTWFDKQGNDTQEGF